MFNEEQISQLNQTALVAGTIGAIGAFCTIITYHLSRKLRTSMANIIYFNSYSELIGGLSVAIGAFAVRLEEEHPLCQYQAFAFQFSTLWTVFGDVLLAANLVTTISRFTKLRRIRHYSRHIFTTIILFSIIVSLPLVYISTEEDGPIFGHSNGWCWIRMKYPALQLFYVHIPYWIVWFIDVAVFTWIGIRFYNIHRSVYRDREASMRAQPRASGQGMQRYAIVVALYLTIISLAWIPSSVNRILSVHGKFIFSLYVARNILTPIRGIFGFFMILFLIFNSYGSSSQHGSESFSTGRDVLTKEKPPSTLTDTSYQRTPNAFRVQDNLELGPLPMMPALKPAYDPSIPNKN